MIARHAGQIEDFRPANAAGSRSEEALTKRLGEQRRHDIAARKHWERVDRYIDGFETRLRIEPWQRSERVVVYRKRVSHESRKNFQLDLFSPDDGHFEYSAVATNKALSISALWHFMAGRGAHEKTLSELKSQLAFAAIPAGRRP